MASRVCSRQAPRETIGPALPDTGEPVSCRGRYVIALTYGRDRDWVRNVLAAGGCEVETRGHLIHLAHPRIVIDKQRSLVPQPIRPILKAIGVTEFMELNPTA
jgi:hypothetical protein